MNKKRFNSKDLSLTEWQAAYKNTINNFKMNEVVYLNSSLDIPLKVIGINRDENLITIKTPNNQITTFPPACLTRSVDRCMKYSVSLKSVFYWN